MHSRLKVNDVLKDKICAITGCYEASSSNSLTKFQVNILFRFLILEDGKEKSSRNVGKELPLLAA